MFTSVIVSTFDSPAWLEKSLWGLFAQSRRDFEILIADDGSGDATADLLYRLAPRCPTPLLHVRQPHDGFRKCRILNKAIALARGERIIVTDGDCVPRCDFVEIHSRRASPDAFLTGGRLMLSEAASAALTETEILGQDAFRAGRLLRSVACRVLDVAKVVARPPFSGWLDRITPTKRTWNGHNASCLRAHAIAANGFEETMGYGGLDVEFGLRLRRLGLGARHVRYSAPVLHLHHERAYATPDMRARSRATLARTRSEGRVRAVVGLDQWTRTDGSTRLEADDRATWLRR